METWLDCVKIYDKKTDTLRSDLNAEITQLYEEYVKRIGGSPRYNIWYDTLSPKCIGADDTYQNSIVPNEASFLTSRAEFLAHPRWGISSTNNYTHLLTDVGFKFFDDGFYENIPELNKFKDSTILIVGGGPSTAACDWETTERDYTWTCNHFYKHPTLIKQDISLVYLNAETHMGIPDLRDYVLTHDTICAADTSITRPAGLLESFKSHNCTTLLFNQRVFLTSGAAPKLIALAVLLGAKCIKFVGMDGWRKEQIEELDAADHAFEPGKKLKVSANYTFDFQRRETVVYWDYFLNFTGKNVEFQNLGETYEHCMSAGISKTEFPLK